MDFSYRHQYQIQLAKTLSAHWYQVWEDGVSLGYFPSSTTILNAYPQSLQLTKWIADNGWQESQKIKTDAGIRGTNIHIGIKRLIDGDELVEDNYSTEEWYRLDAFVRFFHDKKPEIIATELPVFSKTNGYTGTLDVLCTFNGKVYVGDWKSSGSIYDHFPLQVASYAVALEEMTDLKIKGTFIVQFGAKNKNKYRFVEYPDWKKHFKIFQSVKKTWMYDQGIEKDHEPPVLDLPATLKL